MTNILQPGKLYRMKTAVNSYNGCVYPQIELTVADENPKRITTLKWDNPLYNMPMMFVRQCRMCEFKKQRGPYGYGYALDKRVICFFLIGGRVYKTFAASPEKLKTSFEKLS